MKVIFNNSFKTELERLDGNIEISNFSLEYKVPAKSGSQTKEDWLEPMTGNIEFYSCEGIWREKEKHLNLYFMLPEKWGGEDILANGSGEGEEEISSSRFNIIRFYYNTDQTAFILTGEIKKDGIRVEGLEDIVFSQTKNLFDIVFPETTKAKIKTKSLSNDSTFLEGAGVTGENMFKDLNEGLIEKKSYYKYIKIETTEDYKNSIIPYINNNGEKVVDNFVYRVYTGIKLECSNLEPKAKYPYVRYGLSEDGGFVQLHGIASFIDYRYIQGKIYKETEGEESIDGISGLIVKELNKGLTSTIDQYSRQIIYGKKSKDTTCSADYWVELEYYDYLLKEVVKVSSNTVRLTQQTKNLDWNIVDDFKPDYIEQGNPVFIFEHDSFSSGEKIVLPIHTCLSISREDIKFHYEDQEEKDFIKCTAELKSKEDDESVFNIIIETLSDNNEKDWKPIIKGESRLSKITISCEDYELYIYAIQKANVSGLVLGDFNGGESKDKQQTLHGLTFENSQSSWKSLYLTVSDVSSEEELQPDYMWKVVAKDSASISLKIPGRTITSGNLGWDEESCGKYGFSMENTLSPNDAYDVDQGYIVFRRITPDEKDVDFIEDLTWNEAVTAKRLSVPIKKIGNEITLTVPENIEIDKPGPFKVNIKSNCNFKCNLKLLDSVGGNLYFYRTGTQVFTSTEYSINRGIDVWVIYENNNLKEPASETIGGISIIAAVDGKETKLADRNIKTSYSTTPATEPITDLSLGEYPNYLFLDSFEEIKKKIECNFVPFIETSPDSYSGIEIGDIKENYIEANDGGTVSLLNHEIDIRRTGAISVGDFYPVAPETCLTLKTTKDSGNKLVYYLLKKAIGPKVNVYPDEVNKSTITRASLFSTVDSVIDIYIKTRYKFIGESFDNGWSVEFETAYPDSFSYIVDSPDEYEPRKDGFYTYVMHLTTKNIPGVEDLKTLAGIKMGRVRLVSRILTTSTADTLVDSISIPEEEKYATINQSFTDSLVGVSEFVFDVIQSGYPKQQAETLSVEGPRGVYIPCSGATLKYTLNPHWNSGQVGMDNFTIIPDEGNMIHLKGDRLWTEGYDLEIGPWFNTINTRSPYNIDTDFNKYKNIFDTREITYTFSLPITTDDRFEESFSCIQEGIKDGLLLWNPSISERPNLYIDLMKDDVYNVNVSISGSESEIKLLIGLVDITKTDSFKLDITTINVLQIDNNPGFSWEFVSGNTTYSKNQDYFSNLILKFPTNSYFKSKEYKIQLTAQGEVCTHSIMLNINQMSGKGSLYCEKEAYFYSDGTCFSLSSPNDPGIFRFDSDLDLDSLMVDVLDEHGNNMELEKLKIDYYDTQHKLSDTHPGCNAYKIEVKLKPNKSGTTKIGSIRFYQLRDIEEPMTLTNPSIKLMQGHYSLKICSPLDLENYVFDSNTIFGPFTVNPESSEKSTIPFHIELLREEPDGYGSWIKYEPSIESFSVVDNHNWELNESIAPISNYLAGNIAGEGYRNEGFRTELRKGGEVEEKYIPFLENRYDVRSEYVRQELLINVKLKCEARYPTSDDVLKDTLVEFNNTIQLLKPAQQV